MKILIPSKPAQIIACVGESAYKDHFGFLASPTHAITPDEAIKIGVAWAMDNGAFVNKTPLAFLAMLKRYQRYAVKPQWVVALDVPGNAEATLQLFPAWNQIIKAYGYPVALAAQDGLKPEQVNWSEIVCLFVGGTDKWRFSRECMALVEAAKQHGKMTHLGRVNTQSRIKAAFLSGFDTVDGSSFATHKQEKSHMAVNTLRWLNNQMEMDLCG